MKPCTCTAIELPPKDGVCLICGGEVESEPSPPREFAFDYDRMFGDPLLSAARWRGLLRVGGRR